MVTSTVCHIMTVLCLFVYNILVRFVPLLHVSLYQMLAGLSQHTFLSLPPLLSFYQCICIFSPSISISYPVSSRPYRILQWHITHQHTCEPWQLSPWPSAVLSLSKLTAIKQHDPAAPLGSSQMGVSNHSPMHLSVWRCCVDAVLVGWNGTSSQRSFLTYSNIREADCSFLRQVRFLHWGNARYQDAKVQQKPIVENMMSTSVSRATASWGSIQNISVLWKKIKTDLISTPQKHTFRNRLMNQMSVEILLVCSSYHFIYYRKPCHFSILIVPCCLLGNKTISVVGVGGDILYYWYIIRGSHKLGWYIFFPLKIKSHDIEG